MIWVKTTINSTEEKYNFEYNIQGYRCYCPNCGFNDIRTLHTINKHCPICEKNNSHGSNFRKIRLHLFSSTFDLPDNVL